MSFVYRLGTLLKDLSESDIHELIVRYGTPVHLSFEADFLDFECELVRQSLREGRGHDVTCFIECDGGYVVIQKHAYAETGIYRAPSGGVHRQESIEAAALREMYEETGLHIRLRRFLLDIDLMIRCGETIIPWRSLVFLADVVGGEISPIDRREIYDARVMTREQILGEMNELMERTGWGGFRYRAFLSRSFFKYLDALGTT